VDVTDLKPCPPLLAKRENELYLIVSLGFVLCLGQLVPDFSPNLAAFSLAPKINLLRLLTTMLGIPQFYDRSR
jgi:hypothetical protein